MTSRSAYTDQFIRGETSWGKCPETILRLGNGQSLEIIVRAEEVSFEFRAKDGLCEGIADMRAKGIPNGGTGDCKWLLAKDKTTFYTSTSSLTILAGKVI